MKDFISYYENPNEENMNFGLIERTYDTDIIDHIIASCKSLETLKYIKFLKYEYISDEKEIDLNEYISSRRRSKKKDVNKYMYLKDSRFVELRVWFKLTCKNETEVIQKKLLVPIPDREGFYTINGKKYMLLYQIVDASTYTTKKNLTLKSLMPVSITRNAKSFNDTEGNEYSAPTYTILVFRKEIDIFLFYFAKMGVTKTLKYFSVDKVVRFVNKELDKENKIYFQINSKLLLEVNKHLFLKYSYLQSVVFMILSVMTNRVSIDILDSKTYWIERLGGLSSTSVANFYEKGMNTLTFFDRMLDETTKKVLKLHDDNKKDIYSIVRWMIQNFNELRKKDNMDLKNKRLRCSEYIASLLTKTFSARVNRIIGLGNKVTLDRVKEIFKFPGNIIMQELHSSGLLRFDDKINDMDFFNKLKFTFKGPNALGAKNDKNISVKYRGLHPSYLGRIDINVCGSSDPGATGVLTPFVKTDGLYFDSSYEKEDSIFDFQKEAYSSCDDYSVNLFDNCDNISDLFDILEKFDEFNRRNISFVKKVRKEE